MLKWIQTEKCSKKKGEHGIRKIIINFIKNKKMITKEKLIERIKNIPEEKFDTLDSILEEIILIDKIESSLQAAERGEVLTEEEIDKLVDSW